MILTCPECSARYVVDPKALLPNGRVVRCAKCKHSWTEAAPDIDTAIVEVEESESPPISETASENVSDPVPESVQNPDQGSDITEDEFAIQRTRRKKRPRPLPKGSNLPALQNHKYGQILWGWYGLGAFVALFITSFLVFQTTISHAWPPSQKLYRALGLESHGGQNSPNSDQGTHDTSPEIPPEEQFKIEDTVPSKTLNGSLVTLKIDGNITNLTDQTLKLPLLRIALKDDHGEILREWTFKSSDATISEGEKVSFTTSLPNPPDKATSIIVTFAKK
ncbi:MAG: hypothetical protein COB54_02350 [Alphaproteobacteria bacterium]|nr:MAG: hypothetical protein COB54_02350 [Alphaproteobacteria bacterium]